MTQADQGMSPERRRDQILSYLSARDRATVGELSQVLGVSEVTVRKDLDALESQGLLLRVHGGAMASGRGRLEQHFATREQERREEKRRIAQAAAALVRSGQHIFLDGSTTALHVARLLKDREELTVVTNGLYTALELNFSPGITTIVVGGTMRHRSSSLVGGLSADLLQRLRVELGFFGARALTARDGLMEANLEEAQLKQRMVQAAAVVVGVVDASKFGSSAFSVFALPREIDRVITDDTAPAALVEELRAQEIMVDLV
ncbi:MAG TPA: DeoR/GlpR family DNA-binding transcription regulator [Roseiflexaceae bacterium]|nr:DeoR/GlpR family DNA-binding transcription regulator [Roseiflexaceae bacterium]